MFWDNISFGFLERDSTGLTGEPDVNANTGSFYLKKRLKANPFLIISPFGLGFATPFCDSLITSFINKYYHIYIIN